MRLAESQTRLKVNKLTKGETEGPVTSSITIVKGQNVKSFKKFTQVKRVRGQKNVTLSNRFFQKTSQLQNITTWNDNHQTKKTLKQHKRRLKMKSLR